MTDISILQNADTAPAAPLPLFRDWMADAEKAEPSDPNAMSVATIDADGRPGVRILLLKGADERGFVFYTNLDSRKGRALKANPVAALNFHWKTLGRCVRVEGPAQPVDAAESDAYFATRPRGSRIGAWASLQSQPLENRAALEDRIAAFEKKFEGRDDIPRPPHWGGTLVVPEKIEFWHAGDFRLHTRLLYTREGGGWKRRMLFP